MSSDQVSFYRQMIKRMGKWMAPRYLRNRGVPFEYAYFIIFDRAPRIA